MVIRIAASVAELKKNLSEGKAQIETTTASMEKLASSLRGDKLIQSAHNITAAVNEIEGATKLTDAEAARVNATLEKAIAKYQALGKEAPAAMRQLAEETRRVEAPTTALQKIAGALSGTFGQFTAAGLASAGIQKLAAGMREFTATAAKLPAMEASFNRLAAGAGEHAATMLGSLKQATRGMVAEYDLMASANKAMLLGLPVTSQSMGELAKTATVLGKAMGQDATKSLDDLITALGRSSPMILDNLGLSVKVGEANEAYAAKLGKTADQLTDAEKKMAFYTAAMEAARAKQAELGEQAQTVGEIISSVWVSVSDRATSFIADINTGLGLQIQSLRDLVGQIGALIPALKSSADGSAALAETTERNNDAVIAGIPLFGAWIQNARERARMAKEAAEAQTAWNAALHRFNELHAKGPQFGAVQGPGSLNLGRLSDDFRTAQEAADDFYNEWQKKQRDAATAGEREAQRIEREHNQAIATIANATKQGAADWEKFRLSSVKAVLEMTAAIEKKALPAVFDMNHALLTWMPAVVEGVDNVAAHVGSQLPAWKMWEGISVKATKATRDGLSGLSRGLAELAQISSASLGSVVQGLSTLVASLNTAKTSIGAFKDGMKDAKAHGFSLSNLSEMASGISGLATAAISAGKAIWNLFAGSKGRNLVEEFAGSMGGFAALHAQLAKLPADGERLWIAFTQDVGKNNPEQAKKAIADIQAALQHVPATMAEQAAAAGYKTTAELQDVARQAVALWEYMRDSGQYSAEAITQAWERAQEAIRNSGDEQTAQAQKALDAAKASLKSLDDQIKTLADSIANEAPEEFMGVVETQTRARIAALQKERDAAAAAVKDTETALTDALNRVADTFENMPRDFEFHVRTKYDDGGVMGPAAAQGPYPQAAGGDWLVTRPTVFIAGERGPERATFTPVGQGGGGGRQLLPVKIELSGRTLWDGLLEVAHGEGLA